MTDKTLSDELREIAPIFNIGVDADVVREAADHIDAQAAEIADLKVSNAQLVKRLSDEARARGEAEGRLNAAELPGVVEGWQEKCETQAAEIERLTAALELALEYWQHRQQRYKNRHPAWVKAAHAALNADKSDGETDA